MNLVARLTLAALAALLLSGAAAAAAPPPPAAPTLTLGQDAAGLTIAWRSTDAPAEAIARALGAEPGARFPQRLVALRAPAHAPVAPQIELLQSAPWDGAVEPAPVAAPSLAAERALTPAASPPPDAPLTVLRDATLAGQRIVVLSITPLYQKDGRWRLATQLRATLPGVTLHDGTIPKAAPQRPPNPPTNPVAERAIATVAVSESGMQRLTAASLSAAGLGVAALDPSRLQLWRRGQPVPLEERGTGDARLDPGDELRFYAPPPGDRWNAAETYWLTVEAAPGARMAARDVAPGAAPLAAAVLASGEWRDSQIYDSTQPGPDGDHWFAADLRTGPGQPESALDVPLAGGLPSATGAMSVTVRGAAYTSGAHAIQLRAGAETASYSWSGAGDWSYTATFSAPAASVAIALIPGAGADGVEIDSVAWRRHAAPSVGGAGARFAGQTGSHRYQIDGLTAGQSLYDITDPLAPQVLSGLSGGAFQDGPAAREYLLSGAGTLRDPAVAAYAPRALPGAADAVYIAPASLHGALAPLLARRAAQGYLAAAVDVQAIYDRWSFGAVDPAAIRAFLRHSASWGRAPRAAVLVGDGSSDPLDHLGRGNTGLIPPYLAMVDPWLGETACETCFGQLDGESPLDDELPDIAIGRLPVNSAAELSALVAKLVAYETSAAGGDWRARTLLLADNAYHSNGVLDAGGDFAAQSNDTIGQLPLGASVERVYYDPRGASEPWREPDAVRARERARSAFSAGAGLVIYTGHGHQWQWAVTDPALADGALLYLYDAYALGNGGRLPIVLAMTCLTSAFQTPSFSGTTIDERLVLHAGGGAAAVWGSTGMGVSHGHDALERGFLRALWDSPSSPPDLGTLTMAGYAELFGASACCQDALRTYVLLGDPLTPARVTPGSRVLLPRVQR